MAEAAAQGYSLADEHRQSTVAPRVAKKYFGELLCVDFLLKLVERWEGFLKSVFN